MAPRSCLFRRMYTRHVRARVKLLSSRSRGKWLSRIAARMVSFNPFLLCSIYIKRATNIRPFFESTPGIRDVLPSPSSPPPLFPLAFSRPFISVFLGGSYTKVQFARYVKGALRIHWTPFLRRSVMHSNCSEVSISGISRSFLV